MNGLPGKDGGVDRSTSDIERHIVLLLLVLAVIAFGLLFPWKLLAQPVSGQMLPVSVQAKSKANFGVDSAIYSVEAVNPEILQSIIGDESSSPQQGVERIEAMNLALQQPIPIATLAPDGGDQGVPAIFPGTPAQQAATAALGLPISATPTPIPPQASLQATSTPTPTLTITPTLPTPTEPAATVPGATITFTPTCSFTPSPTILSATPTCTFTPTATIRPPDATKTPHPKPATHTPKPTKVENTPKPKPTKRP